MSKTDNTRPIEIQFEDETEPGYIIHHCAMYHGRSNPDGVSFWWFELKCDYEPGNILKKYKSGRKFHWPRCGRRLWHYGGMNYIGGAHREERKQRRRKMRARERAALTKALQMRRSKVYEFDLLPIREDANTIIWDIT